MIGHFDRHFDEELSSLKQKILDMGDIVEAMVCDAMRALVESDPQCLGTIPENESIVNRMQMEIDEICLKLIALHQPTAIDLRFLMGVTKINNELERVGDHSINVSQRVREILQKKQLKPYIDLPAMANITREMFKESLRAFVDLDVEKAKSILLKDDQVDNLRYKIINECIDYMTRDSSTVQISVSIIMLVNNIEKIADHATNIAEIVIFVAQGKDIRHHIEKID
jgi:phosphate transport system protein